LPPRVPVSSVAPGREKTAMYAAVASWEAVVACPPIWLDPVYTPGGNPVIDVPVVPISPPTFVGPVLVIDVKPKAPYVDAVPKETRACKC